MKIAVVNGPNLNILEKRDARIYGGRGFGEFVPELQERVSALGVEIEYFQSNVEGELIDVLQRVGFDGEYRGIVLNPGAYSHYSHAIADCLEAIAKPVVEVHISNIFGREGFRHESVTGAKADAVIVGCGLEGYRLAIEWIYGF